MIQVPFNPINQLKVNNYFVFNFFKSFEVLSKYVALYAASLIKDGDHTKALRLFVQHGTPANPQVCLFVCFFLLLSIEFVSPFKGFCLKLTVG